MSIYNIQ